MCVVVCGFNGEPVMYNSTIIRTNIGSSDGQCASPEISGQMNLMCVDGRY